MFKNLTIKARLIFVLSFLSLLLLGIGYTGLFGISQTNDGLRSVYEDRLIPMGQIDQINALILHNRLAIAVSLVTPNPEFIRQEAAIVEENID
ncbi:MAG: Tar ligand binding domain-containing protein, partial [Gammaproteobacteria bacterium]